MASVDAYAHPVSTIFAQVLTIPDYQRDYSWTPKKEVKALLDDFVEHLAIDHRGNFGASSNDDYLLGPMISTKSSTATEVIDGQQRLITVYLISCALRQRLLGLRPSDGMIGGLDEVLTKFDQNEGSRVARIWHHDRDLTGLLTNLALQDAKAEAPKEVGSISCQRAVRAFKYISQRLSEDIPNVADAYVMYAKFLREHVKLISIFTPDIDAALYVFERANDRGKPLDPSDLLKNLIFRESDADAFGKLSIQWKAIQQFIEDIPKNDLSVQLIDYLRWKHLVMNDGFYSTRRDFYTQISARSHKEKLLKDPTGYIQKLEDGAKVLHHVAVSRSWPEAVKSPALEGIYAMGGGTQGGGRQKQQWPLILAASSFAPHRSEAVARVVEKLLFVSYVTQLKSQTLELLIRKFAVQLRGTNDTDADVEAFAQALNSEIETIKFEGEYDRKFARLNYLEDRALVRYVLVRVNAALHQDSGPVASAAWPSLMAEVFSEAQIDHIWPQSKPNGYSDDSDSVSGVHEIGNLILLDSATNQAAGSNPAEKKLTNFYPNAPSYFVVARNLSERIKLPGKNTQPIRVSERLPTGFASWGREEASILSAFYREELNRSMSSPFI